MNRPELIDQATAAAPADENNDALIAALAEPLDEYDGGSYCDDDYADPREDKIKQLYLEIARQTIDMTDAADVLIRLIGKLPPAETFEERYLRSEAMRAHFNVAYAPAVFDNDIANIVAEVKASHSARAS